MSTWKDKIVQLEEHVKKQDLEIRHLKKRIYNLENPEGIGQSTQQTSGVLGPPPSAPSGYMTMSTPNLIPLNSKSVSVNDVMNQNRGIFK